MYGKGLEAFLAVAMSDNLTKAAEMLNLSQSTVSHNLKQLEESLGVPLIYRKKGLKSTVLTSSGETLLPLAMKWNETVQEIGNIKTTPIFSLTVGCVDSVNHYILSDVYHVVLEHTPKINLKIVTAKSLELYEMIEKRLIDVAFPVGEKRSNEIRATCFKREGMCLLRPESAEIDKAEVDVSELDPDYEIYINWSFSFQIWHDEIWPNPVSPRFQTDTVHHIDAFLSKKENWVIVPTSASNYYKNRGFKTQGINPSPPERICYMVKHRYPKPSSLPGIEIFEGILKTYYPE